MMYTVSLLYEQMNWWRETNVSWLNPRVSTVSTVVRLQHE